MERRRAQVPRLVAVPADARVEVPSLADRQRDTAEYISEMILELRNLARSLELHTVMVPLEFAYYEAFGIAHRVEVPPVERERIKTLAKTAEALDRDPGNGGV